MHLVRRIVLAVSAIGCTVFALAFLVSVISPSVVERVAKHAVRYEIEKRIKEKVESLDKPFLLKKAGALSSKHAGDIEQTRHLLDQQLPARLAAVIAEMQDADCECRKRIELFFQRGLEAQMASDLAIQDRLTALIRSEYMEVATQLIREFRIFTGTNAMVFALLLAAVLLKRQANLHLLPSTMALLAAAAVTAYLYLFQQDWLHTVLFGDYVGFAYLAYLGGVFALLCDILFNRARITAAMLNFALRSLDSTIEVLPC